MHLFVRYADFSQSADPPVIEGVIVVQTIFWGVGGGGKNGLKEALNEMKEGALKTYLSEI